MSVITVILAVVLACVIFLAAVWVSQRIIRIYCTITGKSLYNYDYDESLYGINLVVGWFLNRYWGSTVMLAAPLVSALIVILLVNLTKRNQRSSYDTDYTVSVNTAAAKESPETIRRNEQDEKTIDLIAHEETNFILKYTEEYADTKEELSGFLLLLPLFLDSAGWYYANRNNCEDLEMRIREKLRKRVENVTTGQLKIRSGMDDQSISELQKSYAAKFEEWKRTTGFETRITVETEKKVINDFAELMLSFIVQCAEDEYVSEELIEEIVQYSESLGKMLTDYAS